MIKEDKKNNIYEAQKQETIPNNEERTDINRNNDIIISFDEDQESFYQIRETVEGFEEYFEYLEKLDIELNKRKDYVKRYYN